jgi:hypothetical protein
MSRLIFEGDTISRFGKKIPTPFIEKIKILQDQVEPTISIYLHITEDDGTNQAIYTDLSNLRMFYGFGQTRPQSVELNLKDDAYFALVDENIYNSEGKRFAKFTFIRRERYQQDFQLSRAISDSQNRDTYYSCFIAVVNDEASTGANRNSQLLGLSSDVSQTRLFDRRGTYNIYSNVSSPLVYEKVFTAPTRPGNPNRLATDPVIIYEDASGLPYESVPLQSIQKGFYKTTETFREQLKKEIDNLVASYGTTEDQQLQSLLDSISFIAQTKSEDVDFIVELDKVRNSFPSRTSTSAVGTLYNRLKDILFSANDALLLRENLQKKLVPNTKLVDLRGLIIAREWSRRDEVTYEPRVDDTGDILYRNVFMERQQIETPKIVTLSTGEQRLYDAGSGLREPDFDVTSIFGYFFFDYEKALHKKSNISQIYEVEKLLEIFGNHALDGFFQFQRTELRKFRRSNQIRRIVTPYKDNLPLTQLLTPSSETTPVYKLTYYEPDNANDLTQIPYVIPRAFDTVEGLDGYRLMAFEFQDFEAYDDSPDSSVIRSTSSDFGQSYRFNIYIDDNTLDFYEMLVSQFEDVIAKIKEYLDFAEDFCSYNNIDNRFNDFFKQGVTDYFERQGFVPWELAPKLYAIHLDLVRDQFSGVPSLMSKFAKEQVSLISPNNGTLDVLRNFVQEMEDFYETYYGVAGTITKTISSRRSPDGTLEPSLRDNTEFIATLGYDDLPDIVDFTVDPQPPTKITLWNGNEEFVNGPTVKAFINRRAGTLAMARSKGQSFSEFVEDQGGLIDLSAIDEIFESGVLRKILRAVTGGGLTTLVTTLVSAGAQATALGAAGSGASLAFGGSVVASTGTLTGTTLVATGGTVIAATAGAVLSIAALVALIIVMIVSRTRRQRVRRITKFINKFMATLPTSGDSSYRQRKASINAEIDLALDNDNNSRPQVYKDLTNNDRDFLRENRPVFGNIGLMYIKSVKQTLIPDTNKWFRSKTKNIRN